MSLVQSTIDEEIKHIDKMMKQTDPGSEEYGYLVKNRADLLKQKYEEEDRNSRAERDEQQYLMEKDKVAQGWKDLELREKEQKSVMKNEAKKVGLTLVGTGVLMAFSHYLSRTAVFDRFDEGFIKDFGKKLIRK